jgi:ABC-type polysaccharide/polyol phosphate transport system ATPase subunit
VGFRKLGGYKTRPYDGLRKKCRDKMNQFKAEGKTIVFVSHNLNAVKALCQRTILLNEGRIVTMGDTEKVINEYLAMLAGEAAQ